MAAPKLRKPAVRLTRPRIATMILLAFAVGVVGLAFGAGVLGLVLHVRLPEKHSPDKSAGMIGAMTGLLSSAARARAWVRSPDRPTRYTQRRSPSSRPWARASCSSTRRSKPMGRRRSLAAKPYARRSARPTRKSGAIPQATPPDADIKSIFAGTKTLEQYLLSLSPKSDGQKQALSMANSAASDINKTRLLMGLQLAGGIPWPMLTIVICWSLLMFCGYGLVSPAQQDRGCRPWVRRDHHRQRNFHDRPAQQSRIPGHSSSPPRRSRTRSRRWARARPTHRLSK